MKRWGLHKGGYKNMKEYRIEVFYNDGANNESFYIGSRDEAIIFGTKQLSKSNTKSVFLLRHIIDNKYDVEMQIQ